MPPGFIIAYVDVTDPERYETYKVLSSRAIEQHGAEVLVRGGNPGQLEGDWAPTRVVVLKFPSVAAARTFYDSEAYRAARDARAGAAVMNMIVTEGA